MFLLIDKPKGMTSHDVVDAVRRATGERRVGHGGTLDPNATGLLIIGVGREYTKQLSQFNTQKDKTYEAEMVLGEERDTHDIEGTVTKTSDFVPTLQDIDSALKKFKGEIEQIPPKHSAIKVNGKKAYALARAGREVELKPRKVLIKNIKILSYTYPLLKMEFKVSSGTYIRALARDIGQALGSFAYLGNLRRTAIGDYNIVDAKKIGEI